MSARIAIIGSPGAGKSTLARRLGDITGIEVVHLDRLFWKPGWVQTPFSEWVMLQQQLVQKSSWIIDGHYGSTIDLRLKVADTVIWLDVPKWICIWRALMRMMRHRGQRRSDMGFGCPEKVDVEFLRFIWRFSSQERPRVMRLLALACGQGKEIIRLHTSGEVNQYLRSLGG